MTPHAAMQPLTPQKPDEFGRDLVVTIRLAADGRVYFHDIPPGMLAVALALAPEDPVLAQRVQAAALLRRPDE